MGCCATSREDARSKSQPMVETAKNLRPASFLRTQDELHEKEKPLPMTEADIQKLVF